MDRRIFLASTMTTGMIAATSSTTEAAALATELPAGGLTKATIPTPALVVDLDAFEREPARYLAPAAQAPRA